MTEHCLSFFILLFYYFIFLFFSQEAAGVADVKEEVVRELIPIVRKLARERRKVEVGTLFMDTV